MGKHRKVKKHLPSLEPEEEKLIADMSKTKATVAAVVLLIWHVSVFEVGCATWETIVHLIKITLILK